MEIEGPLYEMKPYRSKLPWTRHGIPATIDLQDERGKWNMTVHLDSPGEALRFPCYALFLDSGNAIIVWSRQLEPIRDDMNSASPVSVQPRRIFCTGDLKPETRKTPGGSTVIWIRGDEESKHPARKGQRAVQVTDETYLDIQSTLPNGSLTSDINDVIRVGVGILLAQSGMRWDGDQDPDDDNDVGPDVDGDPVKERITDADVLSVRGDQTWGCITTDDAKVPVTIF